MGSDRGGGGGGGESGDLLQSALSDKYSIYRGSDARHTVST